MCSFELKMQQNKLSSYVRSVPGLQRTSHINALVILQEIDCYLLDNNGYVVLSETPSEVMDSDYNICTKQHK